MLFAGEQDKPISNDELLHNMFEKIQAKKKRDLQIAANDNESLKQIYNERRYGSHLGKGRANWRRVASIHPLIYNAAIKLYGPNVFKDKAQLKELMKRPEMEQYLTVPITEL